MKQSKELTEFYKAYYSWLKSGAPQNFPFSRGVGLCGNLWNFFTTDKNFIVPVKELKLQFMMCGLDSSFPLLAVMVIL